MTPGNLFRMGTHLIVCIVCAVIFCKSDYLEGANTLCRIWIQSELVRMVLGVPAYFLLKFTIKGQLDDIFNARTALVESRKSKLSSTIHSVMGGGGGLRAS